MKIITRLESLYREDLFSRLLIFCTGIVVAGGVALLLNLFFPLKPDVIVDRAEFKVSFLHGNSLLKTSCILCSIVGVLMLTAYGFMRACFASFSPMRARIIHFLGGFLLLAGYILFNTLSVFYSIRTHDFLGPALVWAWMVIWPVMVTELHYYVNRPLPDKAP